MADVIKTVGDMLKALQQEIDDAKAGTIPVNVANVVLRGRNLQLKTVQLNMQFQRMNRKDVKAQDFNLLTGETVPHEEKLKVV